MTELITRTAIMAACGAACSLVSVLWSKRLQNARDLDYKLSEKQEYLLGLAMALCGALLGFKTTGVVIPIFGLMLLCICGTVTVTDCNNRIIPNEAVLAVLLLKCAMCILSAFGLASSASSGIVQSLIGFGVCFIIFMVPSLMGKAVGAGDVKLSAAMGFLLGVNASLYGVIVMGVMILGYGLLQRRIPVLMFFKQNIPMGPFIASGMFLAYVGFNYSI